MFACSLLGRLGLGLFGCSRKRTFGRLWMVRRDELGVVPNVFCAVLFCLYLCAGFLGGSVRRPISDSLTCLTHWYWLMRYVYVYGIHVTRTMHQTRIQHSDDTMDYPNKVTTVATNPIVCVQFQARQWDFANLLLGNHKVLQLSRNILVK